MITPTLGTGNLAKRLNLLKVSQYDDERSPVRLKDKTSTLSTLLSSSKYVQLFAVAVSNMSSYFLKMYRIEALT